nr:MAG TPA: hypothetical protein [Caudoviricetes sp.]
MKRNLRGSLFFVLSLDESGHPAYILSAIPPPQILALALFLTRS